MSPRNEPMPECPECGSNRLVTQSMQGGAYICTGRHESGGCGYCFTPAPQPTRPEAEPAAGGEGRCVCWEPKARHCVSPPPSHLANVRGGFSSCALIHDHAFTPVGDPKDAEIARLRAELDAERNTRDVQTTEIDRLHVALDDRQEEIDTLRAKVAARPTAWAYEQACAALEKHRQRADAARTRAESAERRAEEAEKKLNAGGPYDALRYAVVGLCLESRKYPKDRQAVFLRDELLTMIDPHMSITQHIRKSATPLAEGEGETR